MKSIFPVFLLILLATLSACAQPDTTMTFEEYEPKSTLVVPETIVESAKYPFIDVHNHQWRMAEQDLSETTAAMDSLNMVTMVNLSGRSGDRLKANVENARKNAPGRFIQFANIDFDSIGAEGWTEKTVAQLQQDYENGAQGLKIFKNLGLTVMDTDGNRVPVDDPRLDPVWAKCGELGIPVLIHTGEPAVFWAPIDKYNERWLEMKQFPNRHRDPDDFPSWEKVMGEQWNVFRKHPETTFINAHLGWLGNDLGRLGELLDEFPNMHTEIGAVLAELGQMVEEKLSHDVAAPAQATALARLFAIHDMIQKNELGVIDANLLYDYDAADLEAMKKQWKPMLLDKAAHTITLDGLGPDYAEAAARLSRTGARTPSAKPGQTRPPKAALDAAQPAG